MLTRSELAKILKGEWLGGAQIVLREDELKTDHPAINQWVSMLLNKNAAAPDDLSSDENLIVSLVYYSLNFDIPFEATAGVRRQLLSAVRTKMRDPNAAILLD